MHHQRIVVVHSPHSTAAARYNHKIKPALQKIASALHEIGLNNVPYFEARDIIAKVLRDGDVVVAAGGDGLVNVTLDAALASGQSVTCAVVPLGNFNDFSRAINGSSSDPAKILASQPVEFHPLDLAINGQHQLYGMQYITFGASAKLTEWLNAPATRRLRRRVGGNSVLFGTICMLNYAKIFGSLGSMETMLPNFTRNGKVYHDNNIGFMVGGIGAYFQPEPGNLHLFHRQLWFHRATLTGQASRDVPYLASWFGRRVPGDLTEGEILTFAQPARLVTQVAGDKLVFDDVTTIACVRSSKSLKLFAPNIDRLPR